MPEDLRRIEQKDSVQGAQDSALPKVVDAPEPPATGRSYRLSLTREELVARLRAEGLRERALPAVNVQMKNRGTFFAPTAEGFTMWRGGVDGDGAPQLPVQLVERDGVLVATTSKAPIPTRLKVGFALTAALAIWTLVEGLAIGRTLWLVTAMTCWAALVVTGWQRFQRTRCSPQLEGLLYGIVAPHELGPADRPFRGLPPS